MEVELLNHNASILLQKKFFWQCLSYRTGKKKLEACSVQELLKMD